MGIYRQKKSKFYWMSKTVAGRQYSKSTETDSKMRAKAVYEEWVVELKEKLKNGEKIITDRQSPEKVITFREFAERYLEFSRGRLKSHKNLEYMVRNMVGVFKDKPLDEFNLADIEGIQNDKLRRGLSIRTANHFPRVLKTMFRKAADWELVDESVLKKLIKCKNIKGENKRLRYLSDEEAARLIECCEPSYLRPIVITALNTGMRRNEILKLTWDRVDLRNRIILLDKTKNHERREIPVNGTLHAMLSDTVRNLKTDYLFYDPRTLKPLDRLDRSWHTALRKAKIVDFHFHDLRHTFASRLVMAGVSLTAVKELLGHKSISMTLRYSHLAPEHLKEAVSVLDRNHYTFTIPDSQGKTSEL